MAYAKLVKSSEFRHAVLTKVVSFLYISLLKVDIELKPVRH